METPGIFVPNVPVQATGPETLPLTLAKLAGTGKVRPDKKISSLPETGTVIIQVLVSELNEMEEQVALGLKVIWEFGTGTL
jgi:hypothetical protein